MRCASAHDTLLVFPDEFPPTTGRAFVVGTKWDKIRIIWVMRWMRGVAWWTPRCRGIGTWRRWYVEQEAILLIDEKLEHLLAQVMFARGKLVVGVRDETRTKDDGKIWGTNGG